MHRHLSNALTGFALFALLGCDAMTRATGQVRDARGLPLEDVIVRLEIGTASVRARSDKAGHYSVRQAHAKGRTPADLTFCKAGYYLARRWFDDSNSIPASMDVVMRAIDTTASPARVAGARAPCQALGVGLPVKVSVSPTR